MRIILASASPARLATLRAAGVDPEVLVSHVGEEALSAPSPVELAQLLATAKAHAAWRLLGVIEAETLLVGCDTVVEVAGEAWGKPRDAAEAIRRWHQLRGGVARVHTGHHVMVGEGPAPREARAVGSTTVHLASPSDAEIDAYVATGEPLRVAGGFAVNGVGGPFITHIDGDHHNVVGLSLPLLRTLLVELAVPWQRLWSPEG